MQFSAVFFMNISILITLAYLFNLGYKYLFIRLSPRLIHVISVFLFIFAGWVTMVFGLRLSEEVILDLRALPLITGIFIFRKPTMLIVIGLGIGLARFTFGFSEAATAGFINLLVLGFVAAALNVWFHRSWKSFSLKIGLSILIVNLINAFNISLLGVIPFQIYVTHIFPYAFPLSLALSCVFIFILYDFYKDLRRSEEIKTNNQLLRRQKKALQEVKKALEDKAYQLTLHSQYKSEFLANMSHELKTPLNSIITLSQLLNDQKDSSSLSEEELQYLAIIQASGEELLRHINDVLDLTKVEAGKLEIYLEEISLREIPQILYDQFRLTAEQKGIKWVCETSETVPDLICTDGIRIHQILKNLLANSFKFTLTGRIILDIRLADQAPEGHLGEWVAFSVMDTGIGIAEDKQQLIFEAFQQADGSISRQYGGIGLGLSISLELAKLLGGVLTVSSQVGKGSTFSLYLPTSPIST
ncbi:Autoinducer 2 sensor kinase/phosphatase LuxQ [compost metagenome]